MKNKPVYVYKGEALASYNFGEDHPFGPDRHHAFHAELEAAKLGSSVHYASPKKAVVDDLVLFHTVDYVDFVSTVSDKHTGYLDQGDTPIFPGVFEAASYVVGTTLAAVDVLMHGDADRAFIPIAGMHHAARDKAAGFCVFNDCGVAIEYLRKKYHIQRIAYIDIDAHHGDGIFYAFENDPDLLFADIHQDGQTLYPGTGKADEQGKGIAEGSKLNIPMAAGSNDSDFKTVWPKVMEFLDVAKPEFIIFQCGADSLSGDPITQLNYSEESHAHASRGLIQLAEQYSKGRIIATGGGGYNMKNLARAWTEVVKVFVETN